MEADEPETAKRLVDDLVVVAEFRDPIYPMEPKFHDGELIFVDPQVAPVSGRYVVVRLEDSQEATFKQLIIEEGHQYLKALNPDWPNRIIEVNSNATISGVEVVFKGEAV